MAAHNVRLEDSNCALIGSSEDLAARVAAARTEEEWVGAGSAEGIQIWRVEKFNIRSWPRDRYGEFFSGDSYIVLHTFKPNPRSTRLSWDVHFWLGKDSTTDERGVAAYKTVELDDLLGTLPVQYREVQGYESDKFMSLFENKTIICLDGGIESGFHHVGPKQYEPRLFHIKGKRRVQVMQVPLAASSLNLGDAFCLDLGLTVFSWLPREAGATEKFRANMVAEKLVNARGGRQAVHFERLEEEGSPEFWEKLGGRPAKIAPSEGAEVDDEFDRMRKEVARNVYKLSDETGRIRFEKVSEGPHLSRDILDTNDVFIIDASCEILCWIGKGASPAERSKAVMYATNYLGVNHRPVWLPITRVCEGRETPRFEELFGAHPAAAASASGRGGGGAQEAPEPIVLPAGLEAGRQRHSQVVSDQQHHLVVKIHECRDLVIQDLNGTSDPYVELHIGNETEKVRTRVIKKCLNPDFNEEFNFAFMTPIPRAVLKVRCFDKDRFSRDDWLGKLDIPLCLLPRGKELPRVFQLQNTKKGTIRMTIQAVDFGLAAASDRPPENTMSTLLLDVENAFIDLPGGVPINPYVLVQMGTLKQKTSVCKETFCPDWRGPPHSNQFAFRLNRDMKLTGEPPEEEQEGEGAPARPPKGAPPQRHVQAEHCLLRLKVKNHKQFLLKHRVLGSAVVPVSLLPHGVTVRRELPLYVDDRPTGSFLNVSLRLVDFPKNSPAREFY